MKLLFLNPPYPTPVARRYMCSYNSPNFLFPPVELLSAATTARELGDARVKVIDAIAEKMSVNKVIAAVKEFSPDAVVSMPGFEIFGDDLVTLEKIKNAVPASRLILFGYLPTFFPKETLRACPADFIIQEEPEMTLAELIQKGFNAADKDDSIPGLISRFGPEPKINPPREYIKDLDSLPWLDYSLAPMAAYSEFGMPTPFAVLQSARGCPFHCSFCVRSYGGRARWRSAPSVVDELASLVDKHHIRGLRFIDDTFTADRKRALEICEGIAAKSLGLRWSCLARPDTLDEELVKALRRAGCRRIYLGIESGSERILKAWNKRSDPDSAIQSVQMLNRYKIESCGFFMFGDPDETPEEFKESIRFALSLPMDFLMLTPLTPYPGTDLFVSRRDEIDFNLIPFRSRFKRGKSLEELERMEREFYKSFYLRPGYIMNKAFDAIRSPRAFFNSVRALMNFLVSGGDRRRKSLI